MKELHEALKSKQQKDVLQTMRMEYSEWLPQFLGDIKLGGVDDHLADLVSAVMDRRQVLVAEGVVPPAAAKPVPRRRGTAVHPKTGQPVPAPQDGAQGAGTTIHDPAPSPAPPMVPLAMNPKTYTDLQFASWVSILPTRPYKDQLLPHYGGPYFTLNNVKYSKRGIEGEIITVQNWAPWNGSLILVEEVKQKFFVGKVFAWPKTLERSLYAQSVKTRRIHAAAATGEKMQISTDLFLPYT